MNITSGITILPAPRNYAIKKRGLFGIMLSGRCKNSDAFYVILFGLGNVQPFLCFLGGKLPHAFIASVKSA